jgi:hypothetical protein
MATQNPLDLLRDLFDWAVVRDSGVEVGVETPHSAGQAHGQKLDGRTQHGEGVARSGWNCDRGARSKIKGFIVDLDDHPAMQDVVRLRPSRAMQWCGRSSGCIDLEELVVIIGVSTIDLHSEYGVRSGELDSFPCGCVLNLMRHTSDARLTTLIESIPEIWECLVGHMPIGDWR